MTDRPEPPPRRPTDRKPHGGHPSGRRPLPSTQAGMAGGQSDHGVALPPPPPRTAHGAISDDEVDHTLVARQRLKRSSGQHGVPQPRDIPPPPPPAQSGYGDVTIGVRRRTFNNISIDSSIADRSGTRSISSETLNAEFSGDEHVVSSTPNRPPGSGSRDDRYELKGELGRGGMGAVELVYDHEIRRDVARKRLHPGGRPELFARFIEEGQITGQLEHPNIVPVHDMGVDSEGRPFITLKRVRGTSLRELITNAALDVSDGDAPTTFSLERRLDIFRKVLDAVSYAHARGVIHRDLKPENIMVGEFGEVLVMDWGLARIVGLPERLPTSRREDPRSIVATDRAESDSALTMAGMMLGTAGYMPIEQARGDLTRIDERSDVFALGALLYELITLTSPFKGDTVFTKLEQLYAGGEVQSALDRVRQTFPRGRKLLEWVPELDAIARHALQYEREDRYPSVRRMAEDVDAWRKHARVSVYRSGLPRRTIRWFRRYPVAGVLLAAAVVMLAVTSGFLFRLSVEHNEALRQRGEALSAKAEAESHQQEASQRAVLARESADRASAAESVARAALDTALDFRATHALAANDALGAISILGSMKSLRGRAARFGVPAPRVTWQASYHAEAQIFRCAFTPDGSSLLFVAPSTRKLWMLDPLSGRPTGSVDVDAEPHSLAITADGRTAAVGLDNGSIAAVDLVQRKQVRTIASATRPISDLRFAPGGRYLAVGSWDWTLRLADINGPAIEGWIAPTEWHVSCVAWSPDGQLMLAGTMKGQLFCFHRTTGLLTSVDLGSPIMDMKFTRNLGLAVLCDDGVHQINYTPLLSGSEVNDVDVQIVIQFERATAFDFSPDEQLMVVAVGAQGKLIVVDLTSDRDRFAAVIESAHQHSVCSIAFSPAGTRFASTGRDGWVHFWNIQPARDTWLQPAAATPHTEAALDPDGKRLVYIGQDGRMRVVDVDKPDEARWIPAHEHEQGLLVHWLTDGRLLTVGHDGAAMIWSRDLRQKELTFRLPLGAGDNQNVISARVIRENPLRIVIVRLADVTMTNERAERLWVAPRPDGHTDTSFLDAIPSADRRKVFVSMTDGSVLQFDAQSGALQSLRQLASIGIFEGFAASPDGRYLLTGAHVGEVACWPLSDAGIGEPQIRRVSSHPDNVNRVLFTPDGRLAITADSTRVAFHDASTWELLRAIDQGMSRLTISGDGLLLIVQSHVDYRVRLLGMWAPDDVDLAERITGRQRVEFTLQCVTAERQAELRSRWPTLPTRFNPPDPPAAAFWYLAWAAARNGIASDDGVAMRKWLAANPTHRLADRARTLLQALADGATAEAAVDLLLAD